MLERGVPKVELSSDLGVESPDLGLLLAIRAAILAASSDLGAPPRSDLGTRSPRSDLGARGGVNSDRGDKPDFNLFFSSLSRRPSRKPVADLRTPTILAKPADAREGSCGYSKPLFKPDPVDVRSVPLGRVELLILVLLAELILVLLAVLLLDFEGL
jgi:hypothetical protein